MRRRHRRDGGLVDVLKHQRIIERNSAIGFGVQLNFCGGREREPVAIHAAVAPVPPVLVIDIPACAVDVYPIATNLHINTQIAGNVAPTGGASVEDRHNKTVTGLSHSGFGDDRPVRCREISH
ncbi:hypothetical protein D3C71_1800460 [compost metagenome]